MAVREGNLEAPTRHPIDWKNPEFYDEPRPSRSWSASSTSATAAAAASACASPSRPCSTWSTKARRGEVDGVDKKDYWKVVDQCYLCDLCYMTKCPYVPPHEWNLDFPHTMLRAKAIKFSNGGVDFGSKFLASTDVHGQFAGIPIVAQAANAVNQTKPRARLMEKTLHVDRNAWLPALATRQASAAPRRRHRAAGEDGQRTPGKVAIFATCYVNYNEPGIGWTC